MRSDLGGDDENSAEGQPAQRRPGAVPTVRWRVERWLRFSNRSGRISSFTGDPPKPCRYHLGGQVPLKRINGREATKPGLVRHGDGLACSFSRTATCWLFPS